MDDSHYRLWLSASKSRRYSLFSILLSLFGAVIFYFFSVAFGILIVIAGQICLALGLRACLKVVGTQSSDDAKKELDNDTAT